MVDALVRLELSTEGGGEGLEWVVMGPQYVPPTRTTSDVIASSTEGGDHMMKGTILGNELI